MTSSRELLKLALKSEVFGWPTLHAPTDEKIDESAEKIAKAIDDYILDVVSKITTTTPAVVAAGIPVATTGGPSNQIGATTGPGAATITPGGLKAN